MSEILVVDDNPGVRSMLEEIIGYTGEHKVITAGTGDEALAALTDPAKGPFSVAFIDLRMPPPTGVPEAAEGGIALAQKIRLLQQEGQLPPNMLIYFTTALTKVPPGLENLAQRIFHKPFDVSDILAVIR